MQEYEVIVEALTPCGGEKYANKDIREVEVESPEAYVQENAPYPILETIESNDGSLTIITGNPVGYRMRFTFT